MSDTDSETNSILHRNLKTNNALLTEEESKRNLCPGTSASQNSASTSQVDNEEIATILDGTFFKIVDDLNSKGREAKCVTASCVLCQPNIVKIRGNRVSSSNFVSHLKRRHGTNALKEYEQYIASKKARKASVAKKSTKPKAQVGANITQEKFEDDVTKFVLHSMSPLRVVENPLFVQIFSNLNISSSGLNLISRRSLSRRIDTMYDFNVKRVKEQLQQTSYVCSTADIWSGKRRSFLGVTAHWLNEDLQRESAALACRRFRSTHSFDRIAELLNDIHNVYGLNINKLVGTITDNGSNFVKAFKTFGVNEGNIIKENSFGCFMEAEGLETSDSDEDNDDEYTNTKESRSQSNVLHQLPMHFRCAAHTLNLCASADLEKALKEVPELSSLHRQVVTKCNMLWKAAGRPKTAEIIEHVLGHTLSRPGETRWNSLYDSLKQILSIREISCELFRALSLKVFIKDNEFDYISEHLTCTRPVAQAIDIVQGENNTYYGVLLPCLLALRRQLQKLAESELVYCKPIATSLLTSVQARFSSFFEFNSVTSDKSVIAALSHPEFKKKWFPCVDSSLHDNLLALLKESVVEEILSLGGCPEVVQESVLPRNKPYHEFFDFGNADEINNEESIDNQANIEILQYFDSKDESLKMLDKHKHIKKVFVKYNTLLPTSAPVERMFSFATITNLPRAYKLADKMFEKRVVLKANLNATV